MGSRKPDVGNRVRLDPRVRKKAQARHKDVGNARESDAHKIWSPDSKFTRKEIIRMRGTK